MGFSPTATGSVKPTWVQGMCVMREACCVTLSCGRCWGGGSLTNGSSITTAVPPDKVALMLAAVPEAAQQWLLLGCSGRALPVAIIAVLAPGS
jgi:hypothetical protein